MLDLVSCKQAYRKQEDTGMSQQEVINSVPVSLRMPEPLYRRLKHLARKEALLRNADVSFADLVREALVAHYPDDEAQVEAREEEAQ